MENVFVLLIVFSGFSLLLATVGWFFEIAMPYIKNIKKKRRSPVLQHRQAQKKIKSTTYYHRRVRNASR